MPDSVFEFYRFAEKADSVLELSPLSDWGVAKLARSHPERARVIPLISIRRKEHGPHCYLSSETSEIRYFLGHFGFADSLFLTSTEYRPVASSSLSARKR